MVERLSFSALVFLMAFGAAGAERAADKDMARPDPIMTPGEADDVPPLVFCNHTTKERRHPPRDANEVVGKAYNVPPIEIGSRYQLDHLIPLSIGGANTLRNLWPQPMEEAYLKDDCDRGIQTLVCSGKVSLAEARKAIAEDWVLACRRWGF